MSSLALSLGALEIGILISSVLYGIATVQVWMYTEREFNDPTWLRVMVWVVWLLETAHTAFIWFLLYSLTVTEYGVPATIDETPWSLVLGFPLASILGSIVQGYFAHRVRILSGHLIVPMIAWGAAVLRCGFGITLAIIPITSKLQTMPNFLEHYEWLVTTPMSINVFVDVLTTATSCFYLIRQRAGFKHARRVVDKLVIYTVETGLITSLCAVAILISVLVLHNSLLSFGIFMVYPKLFSNTFLTSLNARESLRKTCTQVWSTGFSASSHSDIEWMVAQALSVARIIHPYKTLKIVPPGVLQQSGTSLDRIPAHPPP